MPSSHIKGQLSFAVSKQLQTVRGKKITPTLKKKVAVEEENSKGRSKRKIALVIMSSPPKRCMISVKDEVPLFSLQTEIKVLPSSGKM